MITKKWITFSTSVIEEIHQYLNEFKWRENICEQITDFWARYTIGKYMFTVDASINVDINSSIDDNSLIMVRQNHCLSTQAF